MQHEPPPDDPRWPEISVKSGDAESCARGLLRLLTDEPLRTRLSAAGKDFVNANYGKARLIRDISNLYERLLAA